MFIQGFQNTQNQLFPPNTNTHTGLCETALTDGSQEAENKKDDDL